MKSQIPLSSFEDKNAIPKEVFDKICPDGIKDYFYIGSCILDSSNTGWIDLNNDGVKEILISGYNLSAYRGSGGWRSYLFQKKGRTYTLLQEFFGWEIYVLKSKTNGYFDCCKIINTTSETEDGNQRKDNLTGKKINMLKP